MAWKKLLKENSERFSKDTLVQVIHEISTHLPNPVLDNLLVSCEEHFRNVVSVADCELTETFPRLQTESSFKFQ